MNDSDEGNLTEFHQLPVHDAVARLCSDDRYGLSDAQASARLRQHGPNRLRHPEPTPTWRRLLAQLQDTLVILLLTAAAISTAIWYAEGDEALPYAGLVILAIVLLNAVLEYVKEDRADKALAALRSMSEPDATVVRDGRARTIFAHELVPGDLLVIEEG
jgi:P-type Ca2+ transporter type 2C